ncbi:MAG: ester cyclase [Terriglobales bacterium]
MNSERFLIGVLLLAILVLPSTAAPREGKSSEDRDAALPEKWIAAWNSHNPDKMLLLFTDDVFYEDVAFGESSHGIAEVRKFAASEFEGVPDLQLKLLRANIHDGHGTIEWTFSGTDKGVFNTGKKFSVRGVSVIDVRDGKIFRNLDFYDSAAIMRQVGLLPPTATDAR